MSNPNDNKRFEDWIEVDCNSCDHYWDSSCDSVSNGVKRPCNSFKATRKVFIPEELNKLKLTLKMTLLALFLTIGWVVLLSVAIGVMLFG